MSKWGIIKHMKVTTTVLSLECECRVAQDFKLKINPTKIQT